MLVKRLKTNLICNFIAGAKLLWVNKEDLFWDCFQSLQYIQKPGVCGDKSLSFEEGRDTLGGGVI